MRLLNDEELKRPLDYERLEEGYEPERDDTDLVTKDFDVYPYWMILVGMSFLLGFVLGVYW